jgi:periplasmic divalent cation tolerance protein
MTDKIVVLCACGSPEEAVRIARALVEARLAACVNRVPGAKSVYRWNGQVEEAEETLLLIKSSRNLFAALCGELSRLHSYDVPEIVALPVVHGSEGYLGWLSASLKPEAGAE